ncbi:peptidoglycan-binding domain-containing protein [Phytomonospora sp. NPDC050363]|uniref:peptidoglycan-binding domain-containing protein n=1 Tax=Phytomonospora sp. NPDC050363 TaxID=3155642 RepID=UPI003405BCF9
MLKRLLSTAAVVAAMLTFATPAQASTTIVDGGGTVKDDWGDHYSELGNELCNGCADSSNTDLVLMWQSVLYAEGFLVASAVDGYFGSGTEMATKKWQGRYNLTVDGRVGPATWRAADDRLSVHSYTGGSIVRYYPSTSGYVGLQRGSGSGDGNYRLLHMNNGATGSIYFNHSEIRLFSRTVHVN